MAKAGREVLSRPNLWEVLALGLILLVGYVNVVGGYFHAEDMSIVQNIIGADGVLSWPRALADLSTPQHLESYRPLVSISHAAVISVFGIDPFYMRGLNIVAQLICGLCIYFLVARLIPTKTALVPFFAAAFFVANPLHPEAVTYLVSLAGSGALAFYLLSLCCVLQFVSNRLWRYQFLGLMFFIIALGFKEEAISLPFAVSLVVLASSAKERSGHSIFEYGLFLVRALAPYAMVIIAYFTFRLLVLGGITPTYYQTIDFASIQLLNGIELYAKGFLAPLNQQAIAQGQSAAHLFLYTSIAVILPMLVLRTTSLRAVTQLAFIVLAFLVALIPLWKVIAYGIEANLQNSRYLYFPSVAYSIFLSWLFFAHSQKTKRWIRSVGSGLGIIYFFLFLGVLVINNGVWREAANQSERLKLASNLATGNDPNVEIVNVPDSYKGAFFDRNGFHRLFFEPFTEGNLANKRRRVVQITNDTNNQLQINSYGFDGDLRVDSDFTSPLNAGESRNISVDFSPSGVGPQTAELELIPESCPQERRRFEVTGQGIDGVPLKTHLTAALSHAVEGRTPGGQSRTLAVTDLPDGIPAIDVRVDRPPGVQAILEYRELFETGHHGPPGSPVTIADGESVNFVLFVDPIEGDALPSNLAFVPQIKGLNTPIVGGNSGSLTILSTTQDQTTSSENSTPQNTKPARAAAHSARESRLQSAVWQTSCGSIRLSVATIDFGKVSTEPRSWLPQEKVLFFEQPPIKLYWDKHAGIMVPLEELTQEQIIVDFLGSVTAPWMSENSVSALVQNPLTIRSTSTGGKNIFFRELPSTVKRGTHLLLEARSLNTLNPFVFFSWSKAGGADFNAENSVRFAIRPDGIWHTYAVSLEESEVWKGFENVEELRLRFVAAHESIDIRRMQIVKF